MVLDSYIDVAPRSFLQTLDQRNISNGAAEMLKMACIKDAPLFAILEANAEALRASHFQVGACCPAACTLLAY
jgi:3-dehydroquinate synthase